MDSKDSKDSPVMVEMVVEVPLGLGDGQLQLAGEAIRAACGEAARIPAGLPALRAWARPVKFYSSSTGKKFMADHGCEFIRIEARLAHPCDGAGPGDVAAAGALFDEAMKALGGKRGIYGSSGVYGSSAKADKPRKDKLEARWWSKSVMDEMEALGVAEAVPGRSLTRERGWASFGA